jgi:hypothetical protein
MSTEQPWPSSDDWDVTCWHSAVAPVIGQRGPATEVRRAARALDGLRRGPHEGHSGLRVGIAETYAFDGLSEDVLAVLNGVKSALVELGTRPLPVEPFDHRCHNRVGPPVPG